MALFSLRHTKVQREHSGEETIHILSLNAEPSMVFRCYLRMPNCRLDSPNTKDRRAISDESKDPGVLPVVPPTTI